MLTYVDVSRRMQTYPDALMSSNLEIPKTCVHCNKHFSAKTLYTKYCSHECNRKHYKALKRQAEVDKLIVPIALSDKRTDTEALNDRPFLSVNETCTLLGVSR